VITNELVQHFKKIKLQLSKVITNVIKTNVLYTSNKTPGAINLLLGSMTVAINI